MKKIIIFIGFFVFFVNTNYSLANYVEGEHYVVLDKPVKTETGDKIEVRELFWYYCPHCFALEPRVNLWLQSKPENIEFIRQPAVFSERWVNGAIFYYVLEEIGEVDRLHEKLLDAIHLHKTPFIDQDDFVDWLVEHGADEKKANDAFKSYTVRVKLNKSKVNTSKYKSNGVPTIIVNGKYWVDSKYAGSNSEIFKIVDFLIQKESQ
ncbi:MAG TPA: disulfide bond formation protein DsbA [Gammaproteobacteria bacterium]|jgi:thiol:disulfide interchange protein DsbA|nr:thiol:disulfide interchange protein DsbA/DsbL [Gammaproteobacteria bacterium]HAY41784.1 disulfide bond formation protein DsbA [Gammaproteobacteria bacterium]|tara:strand:- start:1938 stop:2558 length:621 start_codon:yes stop_codon:yes gene_type:complete